MKIKKPSKYISLTIGVFVALLSIWQVSGRTINLNSRFRSAAKKAALVPVVYSSTMTVLSIQISQYFINQ